MLKFDLHVHSDASPDSTDTPRRLAAKLRGKGLSGAAVTDHNKWADIKLPPDITYRALLIPAAEYTTDAGHMLVYFLQRGLETLLTKTPDDCYHWREITDAAHAQNALVFLAHPFAPIKNRPEAVFEAVDGIEIYNARIEHNRVKGANAKAQALRRQYGLAASAGSDAHYPGEIGAAYWQVDFDIDGLDDQTVLEKIKRALKNGEGVCCGGTASPVYRQRSRWLKAVRRRQWRSLPKIGVKLLAAVGQHVFTRRRKPVEITDESHPL